MKEHNWNVKKKKKEIGNFVFIVALCLGTETPSDPIGEIGKINNRGKLYGFSRQDTLRE